MDFNKLLQKLEDNKDNVITKKTYEKDTRFWKLSKDADGNGSAKIRFLTPIEEDMAKSYVEFTNYFIQVGSKPNARYYVSKSRKNLGPEERDPVYDLNGRLYKDDKDTWETYLKKMSPQYRKVACIQVIKDSKNPENEGKVFLYNIPSTVFKKLESALNPKDEFAHKFNPFHPIDGADFILRCAKNTNNFPDYAGSEFEKPSPMGGGDEAKIMETLSQQHSLKEFENHDDILPYDELNQKLQKLFSDDIPSRFFTDGGNDVVDVKKEPDNSMPQTAEVIEESVVTQEVDEIGDDEIDNLLEELQAELDD